MKIVAALFLAAVYFVLVASGIADSRVTPRLLLSRSSGTAGTRVTIAGRGCTRPVKQSGTLAWHERYYELHDTEKKPPIGVWRSIPVVRTSTTTLRAVFTVRRTDHVGRGLLDLFCGSGGNATAFFTVTR